MKQKLIKYELQSKIAYTILSWTTNEVGYITVYLDNGMIIKGSPSGVGPVYFIDSDGVEKDFDGGILTKIEFLKLPDDKSLVFYDRDMNDENRIVRTDNELFPYIYEGNDMDFNESNEPLKMVLDNGTVIWDLAANECIIWSKNKKSYVKEKIR